MLTVNLKRTNQKRKKKICTEKGSQKIFWRQQLQLLLLLRTEEHKYDLPFIIVSSNQNFRIYKKNAHKTWIQSSHSKKQIGLKLLNSKEINSKDWESVTHSKKEK